MALQTRLATGAPRRVRLAFNRTRRGAPQDPAAVAPTDVIPEVEFVAYATDCTLSGYIRLDAHRLSDVLNANEQFELVNIAVDDFSGNAPLELRDLVVSRDELLLVHATGPRGAPALRRHTRQHPVAAMVGPYEVRGYLHAIPGANPLASLGRRPPMVAISDASIAYSVGPVPRNRHVETVLINRDLIDSIVEAEADEIRVLDLPIDTSGPLLKDFTEHVLD